MLALEDLHWADPTSLRLTEELAALAGERPPVGARHQAPRARPGGVRPRERPGRRYPLPVPHVGARPPLPEEAERALARSLIGPDASQAVIEAMCAGVEGNPLFLEERLSSLVETGALVKDETAWRLSGTAGTEVPEVLERLIRSRVDRLRPGPREVITSASVLGREFGLSAPSCRGRG